MPYTRAYFRNPLSPSSAPSNDDVRCKQKHDVKVRREMKNITTHSHCSSHSHMTKQSQDIIDDKCSTDTSACGNTCARQAFGRPFQASPHEQQNRSDVRRAVDPTIPEPSSPEQQHYNDVRSLDRAMKQILF